MGEKTNQSDKFPFKFKTFLITLMGEGGADFDRFKLKIK